MVPPDRGLRDDRATRGMSHEGPLACASCSGSLHPGVPPPSLAPGRLGRTLLGHVSLRPASRHAGMRSLSPAFTPTAHPRAQGRTPDRRRLTSRWWGAFVEGDLILKVDLSGSPHGKR